MQKEADVEAKESNNLLKSRVSWYAVNILMYLDHSRMYHILFMTVFKRLISFYSASWFQNFAEIWRFPRPFWHRVCHVIPNTELLKLVCFRHFTFYDLTFWNITCWTWHHIDPLHFVLLFGDSGINSIQNQTSPGNAWQWEDICTAKIFDKS